MRIPSCVPLRGSRLLLTQRHGHVRSCVWAAPQHGQNPHSPNCSWQLWLALLQVVQRASSLGIFSNDTAEPNPHMAWPDRRADVSSIFTKLAKLPLSILPRAGLLGLWIQRHLLFHAEHTVPCPWEVTGSVETSLHRPGQCPASSRSFSPALPLPGMPSRLPGWPPTGGRLRGLL
jgi:hypothetical protein